MAGVFLDEFWIYISQKTKQQLQASTLTAITNEFQDPVIFLDHCDACYIGQFGESGGKAVDLVYKYIRKPAEEMRQHANGLFDTELTEQKQQAQTRWTTKMNTIKSSFAELCQELLTKAKAQASESEARMDEESEAATKAAQATFSAFIKLVNEGSASFQFGGHEQTLSTDIKIFGVEDHGKITLSIKNVDQIHSLGAFLSAMIKGLHGYVHTETLAIDLAAQQAAVVDTWIGCPVQCPYCRKKCSLSKHESTVKHKCSFHQPIGFGGVKVTANKKSLFITCDEFDNQGRVYVVPDGKKVLPFPEHCKECHSDWHITVDGDSGASDFLKVKAGLLKFASF